MDKRIKNLLFAITPKENSDVSDLAKNIRHDVGETLGRGDIDANSLTRYAVIGEIVQNCIDAMIVEKLEK